MLDPRRRLTRSFRFRHNLEIDGSTRTNTIRHMRRLTLAKLRDLLGFEFVQIAKRALAAQDYFESRLQSETGALRVQMKSRFDRLDAQLEEILVRLASPDATPSKPGVRRAPLGRRQ